MIITIQIILCHHPIFPPLVSFSGRWVLGRLPCYILPACQVVEKLNRSKKKFQKKTRTLFLFFFPYISYWNENKDVSLLHNTWRTYYKVNWHLTTLNTKGFNKIKLKLIYFIGSLSCYSWCNGARGCILNRRVCWSGRSFEKAIVSTYCNLVTEYWPSAD